MTQVNAVDAGQVQEKKSVGSVLVPTVGLGVAGGIGGYVFGGKRPSLEEIFKQAPDTFSKENIKARDAGAAEVLQKAADELKTAVDGDKKAFYNAAKAEWAEVAKADIAKETTDALNTAKSTYATKADAEAAKIVEGKTAKNLRDEVVNKAKELKAAEKAVKDAGEAATEAQKTAVTTAQEALNTAKGNVKKLNEATKTELANLKSAQKAVADARRTKFDELANADGVQKTVKEAKAAAKTKWTETLNTKVTEITGRDNVKDAFNKIKKEIPKIEKGKWAAIVGGAAAVVGLIAALVLGKKDDAAQA